MITFIRNFYILFLFAFLCFGNVLAQDPVKQKGGVALYTVREQMQEDPVETLRNMAEIGFKYVEAAGYENGKFYGMSPETFKKVLTENKLKPLSSHHSDITYDNAEQIIKDLKKVGFQYLVVPIPPMGHFTYDQASQTMGMSEDVKFVNEFLNTVGKQAKEHGIQLLYHNHDFEFRKNENGVVPLDYFLENTDPEYVNFQLDLFWITKAGKDPESYFNEYPGRFPIWHVKDMDSQGRFSPVGKGSIDFKEILAAADKAGMKYYFVEQDQTFDGMHPFEALLISRENLDEIGFE